MQPDPPPSPDAPTHRIPARSERQAMDWSLVLASQGLEHVIEHSDHSGWELLVAERDLKPPVPPSSSIRRENRRWPWRKQISTTGEIFDGASSRGYC